MATPSLICVFSRVLDAVRRLLANSCNKLKLYFLLPFRLSWTNWTLYSYESHETVCGYFANMEFSFMWCIFSRFTFHGWRCNLLVRIYGSIIRYVMLLKMPIFKDIVCSSPPFFVWSFSVTVNFDTKWEKNGWFEQVLRIDVEIADIAEIYSQRTYSRYEIVG